MMSKWYWITCINEGQPVIIGPCSTVEEARNIGYTKLSGQFDIIELPTKDEQTATRMLKAHRLNQTGSLLDAMRNVKHPH